MSERWPPFCANEIVGLECPMCEEDGVRVREKETYYDGDEVEAYCSECKARLVVTAHLDITFDDVEPA